MAHPKLNAFMKKHNWVMESGDYLVFPGNQSEFKGGVLHYLEFIEEVNVCKLLCACINLHANLMSVS